MLGSLSSEQIEQVLRQDVIESYMVKQQKKSDGVALERVMPLMASATVHFPTPKNLFFKDRTTSLHNLPSFSVFTY